MVHIKVTPEMLEEVANRASNTRVALESIHNNLCNDIDHLCFQWIGASNQQFVQMFNDAKPKAFTSINSIVQVEEDLKRIAEKFRTADTSYDGKTSDDNIEEGAMCGPLNSEKKNTSLSDKLKQSLEETYEDFSEIKNADESLYDKFKHGAEAAYEGYNKIKGALDDEVESTFEKAGLGAPYHFIKGGKEALSDELVGLADAVIHPIDTFNNTIEAASHPVETFNMIKQKISDSWNTDVVNGDWNSQAEWFGGAGVHTTLAVGQLFLGTKGVDKISMLKPGTKLVEMSQTAKQNFEYAASLFNRNHKEFAIAGAGSGIPSIKDFLWRADSGESNGGSGFNTLIQKGGKILSELDISSFEIKDKHLNSSTAKRARKFSANTPEEASEIVSDALKNGRVLEILDNGLGSANQNSFSAIIETGKIIGTKGETKVKIVYDELKNIWTTYPVK
ncbi:WXG100 family type VII secretion target [Bacillus cytotoxicus]|uniref:WXG100 family type VII secretion target n=1 Tax=Bacillus cereus group sp. BfR-BA-01492 TaxID=2920361 RepID=UPI001F5A9B56|nr:WXG100 family type VII secretion target [Bacillus cereus group sp. BfR-BA-01492]